MSRNRRESFVRLAEKRVNKTIKDIRLIGNLADRSNYRYDDEQVDKIVDALETELQSLKERFERQGEPDFNFRLDDEYEQHENRPQ